MKEYINQLINRLYGNTQEGILVISGIKEIKPNPKITLNSSFRLSDFNGINGKIAELINEQFNVFYQVCLQKDFPDFGKRGASNTALAMPGLWLDIDVKTPEKPYRPDTQDEALRFVNDELPILPTMVISSGYGYHVYYLFNEPWIFKNDNERNQGKDLNHNLFLYVNGIADKHDWKFDNVSDLARILRIPGTLNFKRDKQKQVTVVDYADKNRFSPDELTEFLDKKGIPKDIPKEVKERVQNKMTILIFVLF